MSVDGSLPDPRTGCSGSYRSSPRKALRKSTPRASAWHLMWADIGVQSVITLARAITDLFVSSEARRSVVTHWKLTRTSLSAMPLQIDLEEAGKNFVGEVFPRSHEDRRRGAAMRGWH